MNEILLKILPDIDDIVKGFSNLEDERHEVKQDLILRMYDNKKQVKKLYKEGKLKGWLFIVARNIYTDSKNKPKLIRFNVNLQDHQTDGLTEHYKPNLKSLPEMLKQLSEIERLWIETYINCNFNYSEIQRRTKIPGQKGVARRHAKDRIQIILKKWRHLDIYLHQ